MLISTTARLVRGAGFNSDGLYVESLVELTDRLLMRIDEHTFQTAGPGGEGVPVNAYGLFVIPRSTRPLIVERRIQGLNHAPVRWKEYARFEGFR